MRRIKAALGKRLKLEFLTISSLALLLLCSLAICMIATQPNAIAVTRSH
ncbi:hypothetical protein ACKFKF_15740 [Phormidesmis sp. 146-12]